METFIAAGGSYVPQATIERIIVAGGRATGVQSADGRTIRASQAVVSTLNVHQTFDQLVGRDQLPASFGETLDSFKYTNWTLFGLHLALNETPRFTAASFDPNIERCQKWSLGAETMEDLVAAFEDVKANRPPSIVQFGSGALSVIDPTQAPPGKHTTYAWHVKALAEHGAVAVIADLNGQRAASVADEIRSEGGRALGVETDVGNMASVDAMARDALKQFGRIDILINNAAIGQRRHYRQRAAAGCNLDHSARPSLQRRCRRWSEDAAFRGKSMSRI